MSRPEIAPLQDVEENRLGVTQSHQFCPPQTADGREIWRLLPVTFDDRFRLQGIWTLGKPKALFLVAAKQARF
jgi:hypothetical protein